MIAMKHLNVLLTLLIFCSCAGSRNFPEERYYAFYYDFDLVFENDTVSFHLRNPLMCPIHVKLAKDTSLYGLESLFGQINLRARQDTTIKILYPKFQLTSQVNYIINMGDYHREIKKNKIALPFPKEKVYEVIQGFNGKFSHTSMMSKYAIDFNLKIGDTITSADHGYVVGIIEKYKDFGTSGKWKQTDKSNYLTIYHPHSGLYSQYVHLNYEGALVELGDYVKKGQPIAISGMTGYTNVEHLHFNVKIPSEKYGLISTDYDFENDIKAFELKKGDIVKNDE